MTGVLVLILAIAFVVVIVAILVGLVGMSITESFPYKVGKLQKNISTTSLNVEEETFRGSGTFPRLLKEDPVSYRLDFIYGDIDRSRDETYIEASYADSDK